MKGKEGRRPSAAAPPLLWIAIRFLHISIEFLHIFDVFSGNTQRVLWVLENQPAHLGWLKTSQRSLAQ